MKKIYLFFVAATLAACSAEPLENEVLSGLDANVEGKSNKKEVSQDTGESFDVPELICAGEEATFTFNFNDKPGNISLKVQLYGDNPATVEIEEWYNIFNENFAAGGPENFYYTFEEAGDYKVRYQIGGGGFTILSLVVENCGCEESFTYVDNKNGTYTFTYIPAEDMTDAKLTFTFAQSIDVSGFPDDWGWKGQTMQATMDLEACTSYKWDLNLIKKCGGSTPNNNVWTDFKVNEISKKGDLKNIIQSCS